jgi:hypothetical protein
VSFLPACAAAERTRKEGELFTSFLYSSTYFTLIKMILLLSKSTKMFMDFAKESPLFANGVSREGDRG